MKLKVRPEDFIVIEEAEFHLADNGNYRVYRLTKKGFNTLDVLLRLSKSLRIPFRRFAYGGKKDRYGLTTQYITIESNKIYEVNEDNYSIHYIGSMHRPMGPDLIVSNEFRIVIRELKPEEIESASAELEYVKGYGYPNYFDDQRFGSYSPELGFIGEKIIKGHYNGALKIYLTAIHPEDRRKEKERKRFFYENWGNWQRCLEMAKTGFEKEAFKTLLNTREKPFLSIIQRIPAEELSMFFSAFQSYIWNRIATEVVKIYGEDIIKYKGNYWDYLFYKRPSSFDYLKNLHIPTPSRKAVMPDELTSQIYQEILKELELKPSSFNLRKIRKAFFSSTDRALVVIPDIKDFSTAQDELYKNKRKIFLHFKLPRGSYGTMFIKRLFAR